MTVGCFSLKVSISQAQSFLPKLPLLHCWLQKRNYLHKAKQYHSFRKQRSFSAVKIIDIKRFFSSKNIQEESIQLNAEQEVMEDKKQLALGDWVKIIFKTPKEEIFELPVQINEDVMNTAVKNDIAMHGCCDGKLCCSTCHVYVDEAYLKFMPEIAEEEEDMLDITPERKSNSRLGCQIRVTKELNGAVFTLPIDNV